MVREVPAAALEMENDTEVVPAGTVTEAGTVATAGLELVRDTTAPPTGAGEGRITLLPLDVTAPRSVLGLSASVSTPTVGGESRRWPIDRRKCTPSCRPLP